MKKKELYEAPSVETYDVVLENGPLMASGDKRGTAGQDDAVNDYGTGLL